MGLEVKHFFFLTLGLILLYLFSDASSQVYFLEFSLVVIHVLFGTTEKQLCPSVQTALVLEMSCHVDSNDL